MRITARNSGVLSITMDKLQQFEHLMQRAESLIDQLQSILPLQPPVMDWSALAWRWQSNQGRGYLAPIHFPHAIQLSDLHHVDAQKAQIVDNTAQFVHGFTANNVLLTGARGSGKSSIVKALLHAFADDGLRMVEVTMQDLVDLPKITQLLRDRTERFILYCDDLSFEAGDSAYKALKVVLDGSFEAASDNILVYATSNRRHLIPELMADNLNTQYAGDEVRPADTVEEKTSLSERFGLCLTFYGFNQDQFLVIVAQWLNHFGVPIFDENAKQAALLWSRTRGARSGRIAYQFARDYAGRLQLAAHQQTKSLSK